MSNKQKEQPKKNGGQIVKAADLTLQQAPDYLNQLAASGMIGGNEGFEEVRPSDVKVPYLKIAQKGTPQADEDSESYIGVKKGQFFHAITGEKYGEELRFVPLLKFGTRRLFESMDKGGGILCRSDDMKHGDGEAEGRDKDGNCLRCGLSKFGSARNGEGKGTACSEFYNFPALIYTDGVLSFDPVIIALKSTAIDAAQKLIGLAMSRRMKIEKDGKVIETKPPMWAGAYKVTTRQEIDGKLSWYVPEIDNDGWVAAADLPSVKQAFDFMHELRQQGRLATDENPE